MVWCLNRWIINACKLGLDGGNLRWSSVWLSIGHTKTIEHFVDVRSLGDVQRALKPVAYYA